MLLSAPCPGVATVSARLAWCGYRVSEAGLATVLYLLLLPYRSPTYLLESGLHHTYEQNLDCSLKWKISQDLSLDLEGCLPNSHYWVF